MRPRRIAAGSILTVNKTDHDWHGKKVIVQRSHKKLADGVYGVSPHNKGQGSLVVDYIHTKHLVNGIVKESKKPRKKISFKDFRTVDYMPGEDELIKRNAKKRKQDSGECTHEASEKSDGRVLNSRGEWGYGKYGQFKHPIAKPKKKSSDSENPNPQIRGGHIGATDRGTSYRSDALSKLKARQARSINGRSGHPANYREETIIEVYDEEDDTPERFIKSIINKDNVKLAYYRRGLKMTDPIIVYVNGSHEKGPYRTMDVAKKAIQNMSYKELMSEGFVVKAVTKDGESFTSGVHATKKQAHDMHWKMAKNNKYKSVQVVKHSGKFNESTEETIRESNMEEDRPRMSLDEVLNFIQRRKKAISFRKNRAKVKMGAKRQASKTADPARLKRRSRRDARAATFRKLARGQSKGDVPIGKRISIEKRMVRMAKRIERVALKQLPKIRRMDQQRRKNRNAKMGDK